MSHVGIHLLQRWMFVRICRSRVYSHSRHRMCLSMCNISICIYVWSYVYTYWYVQMYCMYICIYVYIYIYMLYALMLFTSKMLHNLSTHDRSPKSASARWYSVALGTHCPKASAQKPGSQRRVFGTSVRVSVARIFSFWPRGPRGGKTRWKIPCFPQQRFWKARDDGFFMNFP